MRLYFILVRRVPPVPSPVLVEVFDILRRRGFEIESGIPEEMVVRPDHLCVEHDLYILKSHTDLALSLAGVLAAQGAQFRQVGDEGEGQGIADARDASEQVLLLLPEWLEG
jgi:ribosomal protein S6--L-glutamate ligase